MELGGRADLALHSTLHFASFHFERLLMPRIMNLLLATALALAISGCACVPGFVGFDSRCGLTNLPSGQP
jgi:hypothetical protein